VVTKVIGSFIIFVIFIIPLSAYGEKYIECNPGTILDNSTGQCIPKCGDGTFFINSTKSTNSTGSCSANPQPPFDVGSIEFIAYGIITGVIATAFGIAWTVKTRRDERKKEDLELIQNFGNQLSEITREEETLETKLDCSLYAERYLDTLDQIASLLYKELIRKDVADYFENYFKYGMNLWYWYKENVEKIPKTMLEEEFSKGLKDYFDWRVHTNYELPWKEFKRELNESERDRWFYFRWWCLFDEDE